MKNPRRKRVEPQEDTKDDDPSNMLVRAGYLLGLSGKQHLDDEDRIMLQRASRSLQYAANPPPGPLKNETKLRAGLAHARTWHSLTDDPSTWPAVEERVLFTLVTGYVVIGERVDVHTDAVLLDGEEGATHHLGDSLVAWLPLPNEEQEHSARHRG